MTFFCWTVRSQNIGRFYRKFLFPIYFYKHMYIFNFIKYLFIFPKEIRLPLTMTYFWTQICFHIFRCPNNRYTHLRHQTYTKRKGVVLSITVN